MIHTTLLPHQKKAHAYLKRHDPCGLFMFLGSGKSLVALAQANWLGATKILITSDKNNIINTWPDQIYRHTDFSNVVVRPKKEIEFKGVTCVLANYEWLHTHRDLFENVKWDLAILDESSEFKDQRGTKHRAVRVVTDSIPHKILLNGKVMTEGLENVFGQMRVIDTKQKLGRTLTQFRRKFMMPDPQGYGWIPKRSAYTMVQRACKSTSYWLENDGSIQMPECHYHTVTVEATEEQRRLDEELAETFAASFKSVEVETNYAAVVFQKRIQVCGGIIRGGTEDDVEEVPTNKLDVVAKIIRQNQSSKIVVWHTYIPETKLLDTYLREQGVRPFVVDSPERTSELSRFAEAEAPAVLLIRTSLCRGINQLADADIAVYYSNPFSYARRAQSEGRTCRITSGQSDTHYIDIITRGGVDARVCNMLQQKKSFSLTLANLRKLV